MLASLRSNATVAFRSDWSLVLNDCTSVGSNDLYTWVIAHLRSLLVGGLASVFTRRWSNFCQYFGGIACEVAWDGFRRRSIRPSFNASSKHISKWSMI